MMTSQNNVDQKGARTRLSNGSVRPMYNDDAFNSDLDSPVEEQQNNGAVVMRVGKDYQASIPECNPEEYKAKHEALLIWQPCLQRIRTDQLDDFCKLARERHKYSEEQALGMLFWNKHDLEKALQDLSNFAPFPDDWSTEDKVLFEQAFAYHGKSFHRIREMLPDKSIAALVKYYYGWKKIRSRPSIMDNQAKHTPISDILTDLSDESDSESEKSDLEGNGPACRNCESRSKSVSNHRSGDLCNPCYEYTQRTGGSMRPPAAFRRNNNKSKDSSLMPQRINPTKNRKRPPKGIYMDEADLKSMAAGGEEHQTAILDSVRIELETAKQQVQTNKQHISLLKGSVLDNIDEFRPNEPSTSKPTNRWSQDELHLGVQGVRYFGKDFQAIAQIIGTKTSTQVRAFFSAYKRKYNLDGALAEFEANQKSRVVSSGEQADDDDVDQLMPLTPPPLTRMPASPSRSPAATHKGKVLAGVKGRSSPKLKPHTAQSPYSKP
ncbi:REST corepressor 2-like [Watersipora subatra]|uniref:REST corepressor 2-like n=1 Tax=Watersipora subatra TaxID=2589382 RepID=UPI00355BEE73